MPRSLGIYSAPPSSWNPGVDGIPAATADFNALLADLSAALTQSIARDGQSPPTANLPMGGFKLTALAPGSVSGDAVNYGQLTAVSSQLFGVGQTWKDVSGSRSLGVIYTNTSGKPIMVAVSFLSSSAGTSTLSTTVGAAPPFSSTCPPQFFGDRAVVFVVPNNTSYLVAYTGGATPTLGSWYELNV